MHENGQSPNFIQLPGSPEEIQSLEEVERIFHEALQAVSDAVEGELAAHDGEDQSETLTRAINNGTLPPVAMINGVRGTTVFHVFNAALNQDTYSGGRPITAFSWGSDGHATGERRRFMLPLGDSMGFMMTADRVGSSVSAPYSWGTSVAKIFRPDPPDVRLRQDATTAFALGSAVRAWQENPQPLPVLPVVAEDS
jgi:hypothetical protein